MKCKITYDFLVDYGISDAAAALDISEDDLMEMDESELEDVFEASENCGELKVGSVYNAPEYDGYELYATFNASWSVVTEGKDEQECREKAQKLFEDADFGDYDYVDYCNCDVYVEEFKIPTLLSLIEEGKYSVLIPEPDRESFIESDGSLNFELYRTSRYFDEALFERISGDENAFFEIDDTYYMDGINAETLSELEAGFGSDCCIHLEPFVNISENGKALINVTIATQDNEPVGSGHLILPKDEAAALIAEVDKQLLKYERTDTKGYFKQAKAEKKDQKPKAVERD